MLTVVLLSGGVDSAVAAATLREAGRRLHLLFVDYGQPAARQEERAARRLAEGLQVPLSVLRCPLPLGRMGDPPGAPGPRVVPGRNLALVALGASHALRVGASAVALGVIADDAWAYPDCRPGFLRDTSRLLIKTYGIRLEAPLRAWPKTRVLIEAEALGIPLAGCWSCYTPLPGDDGETEGRACGTCNGCRARREAA